MVFINNTEIIGVLIGSATTSTTGSIFLTLLIIILILFAISIMFGIPTEYTAIIVLPLGLSLMAYYGAFVPIGFTLLIYLAFIITKKFLFR